MFVLRILVLFRHLRKLVAVVVLTLDQAGSELARVHRIGVLVLECRVAVLDGESVLLKNLDGGVRRNVRELHLLSVPLKNLVEGLEPYGCYAKVDHLAEWTCLAEV